MGNSSLEPVEAVDMELTADSAGSADRGGLEPPRVDPPIRRRKRKKGSCLEASAAKAKATFAEAAAEAPLPPPTVEEAAAKAPAPPPPALALLPPEVPMLGVDAEEVPPQEESEDEPQITGVRTVGPTVWTIPWGVPLTCEERGGVLDDGDGNYADHTIVFPEDGERTEPGGCNR